MKRLEDIPKQNIYRVPEGYFDHLPQVIQTRVSQSKPTRVSLNWTFALRYAMPVVVILTLGVFWWQRDRSVEAQLENIDVQQLAYFLEDEDFAIEELTETVTWSSEDMEALEESVYSTLETTGGEWDDLLEEFDLDMENL